MFVEFLRLSLFDRANLFEERTETGERHTRESWLRHVFSKAHNFTHRGADFTYLPDPQLSSDVVVGRIGRERFVRDNAPPEEGFQERVHEEWQASLVIIDPTHHGDGQKVGMQSREEEIGKPVAVFQSLVQSLNADDNAPFLIEAFGLVEPESFWDFVSRNKGEVVSVTIEAAAPNMFGGKTDFENELKALRDYEKAQKTKIQLQNESGLQPDTTRMHEIVDYTVAGGGAIKAKTRRKKTYNSRHKTKRIQVAEPLEREALGKYLADVVREAIKTVLK